MANGNKKNIVLVDDHVIIRNGLKELIEKLGDYRVKDQFDNGPLFLHSLADAAHPDLLILDISMPGMDGHELARLIREREQCALTRLVALTGYTDAVGSPEAEDGGFDFHLVKPLSLEDLADVLRSPPSDPIR